MSNAVHLVWVSPPSSVPVYQAISLIETVAVLAAVPLSRVTVTSCPRISTVTFVHVFAVSPASAIALPEERLPELMATAPLLSPRLKPNPLRAT